jgi:gas vesicle protein
MGLLAKYKTTLIGALIGMVTGYVYYRLVGCESGSCAITSNPLNSSLYGVIMGGLLGSVFNK